MKRFVISSLMAATMIATGMQAGEIRDRQFNQQQRIGQGVRSGQLTAGETARLEHKEAYVNREIARDRFRNDGKLTGAEKARINHQQNVMSRDIYRDKHNGFVG